MSKGMNGAPKTTLLSNRNFLRLTGSDRYRFLQGLISHDIQLAMDGEPLFTAFLTPHGKVLFDFFVIPHSEYLLIDCEAEQLHELMRRLMCYKMRADVFIEDTRNYFSIFGCWGAPNHHPQAFTDPRTALLGKRIILPKSDEASIPTTCDERDYKEHRYKHGVAEGSHEIEMGIAAALEPNFDALNAISWHKGCYMGQELTALTRYRGIIRKRYLPFKFEGLPPVKHHELLHAGHALGRVMAIGMEYGLGLFQLDKIKPFIDEKRAIVHQGTTYNVTFPEYLSQKIFETAT